MRGVKKQVFTDEAILTVALRPPVIRTQPGDARAKAGTTVTFKAKVSDRTATLQWYYRTSSGAPWLPLEGETGPAMTVLAEAADSFSAARPTPTGPPIPGSPP